MSAIIEILSNFQAFVYCRKVSHDETLFYPGNYSMLMFIYRFTLYIVQDKVKDLVSVSMTASELNIPGIYLVHDFISAKEEEVY
jgi:hypothetical protein